VWFHRCKTWLLQFYGWLIIIIITNCTSRFLGDRWPFAVVRKSRYQRYHTSGCTSVHWIYSWQGMVWSMRGSSKGSWETEFGERTGCFDSSQTSFSAPKVLHLLRWSPSRSHPSLQRFDSLLRMAVQRITNSDLSQSSFSSTRGGYRGGSPTAVQAWRTCPLWELSPSHPILV